MSTLAADCRYDGSFDDLVSEAYGIGADSENWQPLLERLRQWARARLAFVGVYDLAAGRGSLLHAAGVSASSAERFADLYSLPSDWVRGGGAEPLLVEPVAARAAAPDGAFYAEWLDPTQASSFVQALVRDEPARPPQGPSVTFVALARERAAGEFSGRDIARLRALVAHLRRAMGIHDAVAALKARQRAAMAALDMLGIGVMILDGDQRPIGTNRYAQELIALRGGNALGASTPIMLAGGQGTTPLQACSLLSSAANGSGGHASIDNGPVVQTGMSADARPVLVTARRLDDSERNGRRDAPATVVFLSDSERKGLLDPETVRRLYGLTRAEANVAVLLAEGRHLDQAADDLDISINTARTHLKRVLDKTNTTRQADLVRLLLNPCTQIRV